MLFIEIFLMSLIWKVSFLEAIPIDPEPVIYKTPETISNIINISELNENIDILSEIQKKVDLLSERMHKYKQEYANIPENSNTTDDIISADCLTGCDVSHYDNGNSNMTNITLVTINFEGLVLRQNEDGSYSNSADENSARETNIIRIDQDVEPDFDEVLHFPVEIPPDTYKTNPKDDVEVFDPSEDPWPVDSIRDNDADRHWIISTSDIDHDTGLLDTNIFSSNDMEYPEMKIYQDPLGNINEEAMRMHEARHRQKFDEIYQKLFG